MTEWGREQDSVASYDRHLDIDPYSHDAWYNRGIVLNRITRYREAIDSYDMALVISEEFASHTTTVVTHLRT